MLRINNLTCGYDSEPVLKDINMNVEEADLVGIIGPNGSGKTTLLRAITRVLKPQAGEITFRGRNVWQMGIRELAREVAVVSQSAETAPMAVEEYVLLGRIPYYERFQFLERRKDRKIARQAMELTGSLAIKDKLMGEISGGERQLALIARALAQEPSLLLLDEPTAHLDIAHQVDILDLVRRLNREFGLTVITVLHDLNLASEYCRRLVLLSEGTVRQAGPPEEVIDYKTIEDTYNTVVVVEKNPISGKPFVLVVSQEQRLKERKGQ